MSKELCRVVRDLSFHADELERKLRAIYQARLDMIRYPNTPKYDLIISVLLPRLENEVIEEKNQVDYWSKELEKMHYQGNETYGEWYV